MVYVAKHKVLTYFIQYGGQIEIQISDIFVNFKKSFHDCFQYNLYMLQVSVIINFGYIFTVRISLVMEYFVFHKVFIIMYRLHTRLTHPF